MFIALLLCLILPFSSAQIPNPLVYPPDECSTVSKNDKFDFVIVGGGSAGSVVASRLAEVPDWSILLIEGGNDPGPNWAVPSLATLPDNTISWGYKYKKSPDQCLSMNDGQCDLHRARVLGGCSVVNLMLFVRGNRADWDEWDQNGCKGWAFKYVLPYFKKLENYLAYPITDVETNDTVSKTFHATGGPMDINLFPLDPFTQSVRRDLREVVTNIGYREIIDFNGKHMVGFGDSVATLDRLHLRVNAAKAYLRGIRLNLKVCKNSIVSRVLFEDKKAVGVEFTTNDGSTKKVFAKKEVILSAGAISTPPILERSGVGQKALLKSLGIEVVHDLPGVGENLQDVFLLLSMAYALKARSLPVPNPFAVTLTNYIGFINTTSYHGHVPDILVQPLAFPKLVGSALFLNFGVKLNYKKEITAQYVRQLLTKDLFIIAPGVLRQDTRGSVHIKSEDPLGGIDIIGNHFTSKIEIGRMLRAVRYIQAIFAAEEMEKFDPQFVKLDICLEHEFDTDDYWKCLMKHTGSTLYHPVGSCKMGPETDFTAVVDQKLRVYGVKNLRVIDASIMPVIPRGHTNAPTLVVAEKGSDLVKKDWLPLYAIKEPIDVNWDLEE